MLIRRVGSHVKSQDWFAVGIDLVVVVIGVFIGLQATSWNEARIAHSRTETYYKRLATDLHTELDSRQARIKYYEQTKHHGEAVLRALKSSEPLPGRSFLIDLYQSTQRWVYTPQRTTYDELIAAGIADAIPDVEIRTRLANLYVSLEQSSITQQENMPFRDELRRHLLYEVQSAIRGKCDDQYRFGENDAVYLELPATCDILVDDSVVKEAISKLSAYKDLEMDLTRHISILDSKLNSLRRYESPIRRMIELLDEQ